MKYDDEDVRKRGKMGVWKRGEEGEEGGGVKVKILHIIPQFTYGER